LEANRRNTLRISRIGFQAPTKHPRPKSDFQAGLKGNRITSNLPRIKEGEIFKPEEYITYFEDLKTSPGKELGQKSGYAISSS
jgi:hypothetical protein